MGAQQTASNTHSPDALSDPTYLTQFGMKLGVIAFTVAGALVITSEYASGMIRTSLIAAPARTRLLTAKAGAFTSLTLVAGLVTSTVSFALGRVILTSAGIHPALTERSTLQAVLGGALYLATAGLLAFCIGALLRSPIATMATVFLLYVLPMLGSSVAGYLPLTAGMHATIATSPMAMTGYLTLAAWTAAAAAASYTFIRLRAA